MNIVQKRLTNLKTKTAKLGYLKEYTGGLSETSKMPGYSFSIPAGEQCKTGSKMVDVEDSVCSKCYANKRGNYRRGNVIKAQERRLFLSQDKDWHLYMTELIRLQSEEKYFRWFDSGDLQSVEMLDQICKVAIALPDKKFWLPTKERGIVREYKKSNPIPPNLVIRISDVMIGTHNPPSFHKHVSGVTTFMDNKHICPAYKQDGHCLDCRKCWDKRITRVNYLLH